MIPQGSPQSKDTGNNNVLVVWGFWLIVKGIPIGFATGETSYRTNNNTMSFGDAMEGAKSSALARNCKALGISLELWSAEWVSEWKKNYAKKIPNPTSGRQEMIWVRNDDKRYQSKPAPKPAAKPATKPVEASSEVPPTKDAEPVDKAFPPEGKSGGEGFTLDGLRKSVNIKAIKEATGKDNLTVIGAINSLDKNTKHTVQEVIEILNSGEKQDG
jgi:hypothetical protein